jgi:PhnB protein
MSAFKPPGWPSLVPRLFAADPVSLALFIKAALGATGEVQTGRPTELSIDGSMLLVSDGAGVREATASVLYLYVPDCDATYAKALDAGATSVEPPDDAPYGDRRATVRDPAGNTWQIATRQPASA